MSLITCRDVSLSYEGKQIVSGLNFHVESGDYLCIIGENGSGKSTLMSAILGLKGVSGGKIVFSDGLKQSEIGYIPQQTMVQKDFPASVYEVVISGTLNTSRFNPFYTSSQKQLAKVNMERLGIEALKNRCYRELSGGQQQRVLLARALCATKKLLLLDEPVAGLDPLVTNELYSLIAQLNKEGITIIMISHDINSVYGSATHVLHIRHNDSYFGTREQYFASKMGQTFMGGTQI